MNVTQADLLAAMEKEPALTAFGLGIYQERKLSQAERRQKFEGERKSLERNLEQFRTCCEWLSLCTPRKTLNYRIGTSYGLKHRAERHFKTYVTNGAFIAAVIHLGIPYKVAYPYSPNVHVALSSKLPPLPEKPAEPIREEDLWVV